MSGIGGASCQIARACSVGRRANVALRRRAICACAAAAAAAVRCRYVAHVGCCRFIVTMMVCCVVLYVCEREFVVCKIDRSMLTLICSLDPSICADSRVHRAPPYARRRLVATTIVQATLVYQLL
jgi:hypothetical protein